jgi:hypothetical protein
MSSRVGITIEMTGVPVEVVEAFKRNASDPVAAPIRREPFAVPATRPREQRARTRSTSPSRGSPDDLGDLPHRLSADERRWLKTKIDARRREIVRASERAERSLERERRRESAA